MMLHPTYTPQKHLVEKSRDESPENIQRNLEMAERLATDRMECECGASGCARSAERWAEAAREIQEIARTR